MKKVLKKLAKACSRPGADRGDNPEDKGCLLCAVSQDGDFLMAYTPYGRKLKVKTDQIKSDSLKAWWFNPRDGRSITLGVFSNMKEIEEFAPHAEGRGSDWLLIIDDVEEGI